MKKTIVAILAFAGVAFGAETVKTDTYVITFESNAADNHKMQDSEDGIKYNFISSDSNGGNSASFLWNTDGDKNEIGFTFSSPLSGAGGQITSGFSGDSSSITSIFGAATLDRTITGGGGFKFTNAAAGSYTLFALAARGNNYSNSDTTSITYSLNGISDATVGIVAWSTTGNRSEPTLNDSGSGITAITTGSNKTATDWVLMKFEFELTESSDIWLDSQGGSCNLAAISLSHTYTVPEPTTATLSLLALCGLAARRRRK